MQQHAPRQYKYYDFVMAAFVTVLLCANLIGPGKVTQLWGFTFSAGVLFFPASYLFGDFLTEVYGYKRARRVVWAGFGAQIFASFMAYAVVSFPPAADWPNQAAYETVYGQIPRIVLGSITAFWCGEFVNSYVLAKMKIWTSGKFLFTRTIGSTIAGEAVDSFLFWMIAFYGVWPNSQLFEVMFHNYLIKVAWEAAATPVTYKVVAFLKRVEHEDYYDRDTRFTPFSLET